MEGHIRMKFKIKYVQEQGIVQIKPSGQRSRNDRRMLAKTMLEAGRKRHFNSFLLNQTETAFGLSLPEISRLPDILRQTGFGDTDRVAVLLNNGRGKTGLLEFVQDVLAMSCMRIQVFVDNAHAIDWLKSRN